jgi:hypothetical protein
VLLINFSNKLKLCAPKPARTQSPKTLAVIVGTATQHRQNDKTETAMNKIQNSNFKRLVGVWKTTGDIKSEQDNLKLIGIDSYELILDGNFILHKADVKMGNDRSETLEIIKLDNSSDKAIMQYFNTKGEDDIMRSSIINNEFKIEGNGLKFNGTINEENTKISGKWYIQTENEEWKDFIDLNLEKQKSEIWEK